MNIEEYNKLVAEWEQLEAQQPNAMTGTKTKKKVRLEDQCFQVLKAEVELGLVRQ